MAVSNTPKRTGRSSRRTSSSTCSRGTLALANPEIGEVKVARPGEGIFFRRDTWHHGFNYNADTRLRALELFAPPPSRGTSSSYAQTRPNLTDWTYRDDTPLTQWPLNRGQIQSKWLFTVIRENDVLWRIEDTTGDLLVGLYVSTEHLTVGRAILLPGRHGPVEEHDGDESLYVLEGRLNIFLPNADAGESWYELGPGDGFYVPRAHRHQYHNVSPQNTSFLFGVAPSYLPVGPEEEVSHH